MTGRDEQVNRGYSFIDPHLGGLQSTTPFHTVERQEKQFKATIILFKVYYAKRFGGL